MRCVRLILILTFCNTMTFGLCGAQSDSRSDELMRDTLLAGLMGAGVGAAVGSSSGKAGKGAAIGAGIGILSGILINSMKRTPRTTTRYPQNRTYRKGSYPAVPVSRPVNVRDNSVDTDNKAGKEKSDDRYTDDSSYDASQANRKVIPIYDDEGNLIAEKEVFAGDEG